MNKTYAKLKGGPSPIIDLSAMKDNWEHWESLGRSWDKLDRVYTTEAQVIALSDPLIGSGYLSSKTLLHPSIPEFTAIVQEEGRKENTIVCYRRSLLTAEDVMMDGPEEMDITVIPLIDAYVYVNNKGGLCNFVATMCKGIFELDGKEMTTTLGFVTYRHDDPFTDYMINNDPEYFEEFERTIKFLYMEVQMVSIERPELISYGRTALPQKPQPKGKGKKRKPGTNTARFVSVIRMADEAADILNATLVRSRHNMTCPCWGVAGHWRNYKKTGKRVWIDAYRKGPQRHDPNAYRPKNYQIPEEDYD